MRSVFVLGLAAAAASSVLGAQTPVTKLEAVSSPSPIDKTTQTEDVAFQTEKYDRMTVPVTVSGTGPYRFLVDTGADRTAISRDIATNLILVMFHIAERCRIVEQSNRNGSPARVPCPARRSAETAPGAGA